MLNALKSLLGLGNETHGLPEYAKDCSTDKYYRVCPKCGKELAGNINAYKNGLVAHLRHEHQEPEYNIKYLVDKAGMKAR